MPYPFALPTTSNISFTDYFNSSTHPSLPLYATTARGVLKDALKKHKRIPPASQPSNLPAVQAALDEYLAYLFALDGGLSGTKVAGEEIDLILQKEPEVMWRSTLTAALPGREPARMKLKSLESEVFFALSTLAYVHSLLARAQLHILYGPTPPTADQRSTAITSAMRYFLKANAVHTYLVNRAGQWWTTQPAAVDISIPVLGALAELTMSEATLITVLKDDPYPALVQEDRNKESREWMYKGVEIPKVRAHLFARLCLAAAEHASKSQAMLGRAAKVDESLVKYVDNLRRTARGKACRFLGIDAELAGKAGEGIGWLNAAQNELGLHTPGNGEKKPSALSKLKKEWAEKREDRKTEKGEDWGTDAGKFEEGRIVEMLRQKWVKMNDTIGVQLVPAWETLRSSMPSGREYHTGQSYVPPSLDEDTVVKMRAPPEPNDSALGVDDDDDSSSDERKAERERAPGAFPESSSGTIYY